MKQPAQMRLWRDRGCREKYDHYFTNQRVFRATCKQVLALPYPVTVLNSIKVQHVVPEVTIPPETTPENVTTYIVDSGCMSRLIMLCMVQQY